MERREFIQMLGGAAGAVALSGCCSPSVRRPQPRLAFDLGVLRDYIAGSSDGEGQKRIHGVGLAKTFRALSAMGFSGVEFAGYFDNDAKTLKAMLNDSGLVVCASQTDWASLAPDKIAETCEFNLNFGNNLLVCSEGNAPIADDAEGLFLESAIGFYNEAVAHAAACGCRLALRADAKTFATEDGEDFLEAFFERVDPSLGLELDVTSCEKPWKLLRRFENRSWTMRARMEAEADWDDILSSASDARVAWCVVTGEKPFTDLSGVLASSRFFQHLF